MSEKKQAVSIVKRALWGLALIFVGWVLLKRQSKRTGKMASKMVRQQRDSLAHRLHHAAAPDAVVEKVKGHR